MKEPVNNGTSHNMLAVGTKIVGNVSAETDIRIDGEIEGEIVCPSKVIVGTTGIIKGVVNCQNADVMGKIEGKITASDAVSLKATSNFNGDIITKIISIEAGAKFNGTLKTNEQ
ncbi:MAG: polymer-forming cytoskeletal protein [Prevotellaceae bacterium]|nr:polymer-forming cytoskeletal protein [Prevotellaceae bacterium]